MFWIFICTVNLTVCSGNVTYAFQRESALYSCVNVKELLARRRCQIWSLSDFNWTRTQNHLAYKRTLNHMAKLTEWLSLFWVHICRVNLTVCFCHVRYAFPSESTVSSCLNVKELVAARRRQIWNLSECNWTQTQNHLVRQQTLKLFARLTKWLSSVLITYLHSPFDVLFWSCHVRIWKWIQTL